MYLAPRNSLPATQAWKALVGFAENAADAQKTEALLTAIDRYADKLPDEREHEYRAKVAEYCLDQDRAGAPVELKELSRHVDEDAPDALLDFLAQHMEEAALPLYTDRRQLKRYTRLFGRDNDLSIGFSTQMLGNNIIYDENAGTLTIRSIPRSLKSQLARHARLRSGDEG
jgi:nucleoid-associated protein